MCKSRSTLAVHPAVYSRKKEQGHVIMRICTSSRRYLCKLANKQPVVFDPKSCPSVGGGSCFYLLGEKRLIAVVPRLMHPEIPVYIN